MQEIKYQVCLILAQFNSKSTEGETLLTLIWQGQKLPRHSVHMPDTVSDKINGPDVVAVVLIAPLAELS